VLFSTALFAAAPLRALPPPTMPFTICPSLHVMQELKKTWPRVFGNPSCRCERVENPTLFQLFSASMRLVAMDMNARRTGLGAVAANANLPNFDAEMLRFSLNAAVDAAGDPDLALMQKVRVHYLFHATKIEAARDIVCHGFSTAMSGSSTGSYFGGHAIYTTDAPTFAQGYSSGPGSVMLLNRVILGDVFETSQSTTHRSPPQGFDSLLGRKSLGAPREFVVYDRARVLPEFVIYF
jgi:hypothetical protein